MSRWYFFFPVAAALVMVTISCRQQSGIHPSLFDGPPTAPPPLSIAPKPIEPPKLSAGTGPAATVDGALDAASRALSAVERRRYILDSEEDKQKLPTSGR